MWWHVACEALQKGCCLELRYDGYSRIVEVHAVGLTKEGNPVMRCWQVSGGSASGERVGWKLFRLDEARGGAVHEVKSAAPRTGYARGDRAMASIRCQL